MGRPPSRDELGLKKGPWTPEEDKKLKDYIERNGHHGSWRGLPKLAGLNRCGKSCRLRWTNYMRPDIKRGKFTEEEEKLIIHLHSVLGNKWSTIATSLPGRTDNEIKNYWNTHLRKKLLQMGIDPVTHQPRTDHLNLFAAGLPTLLAAAAAAANVGSLNSVLQLQADAAHLIKLQLVQNMVQLLTCSSTAPTPNLDLMGLPGLSSLHLPNLVNGLARVPQMSSVPTTAEPSAARSNDKLGLHNLAINNLQPSSSTSPPPAPAPTTDDLSSEMNKDYCGTSSSIFVPTPDSAPTMVSASPENTSKSESIPIEGFIDTPISTPLKSNWDQALNLNDLEDDLLWKEALDQVLPWLNEP